MLPSLKLAIGREVGRPGLGPAVRPALGQTCLEALTNVFAAVGWEAAPRAPRTWLAWDPAAVCTGHDPAPAGHGECPGAGAVCASDPLR